MEVIGRLRKTIACIHWRVLRKVGDLMEGLDPALEVLQVRIFGRYSMLEHAMTVLTFLQRWAWYLAEDASLALASLFAGDAIAEFSFRQREGGISCHQSLDCGHVVDVMRRI